MMVSYEDARVKRKGKEEEEEQAKSTLPFLLPASSNFTCSLTAFYPALAKRSALRTKSKRLIVSSFQLRYFYLAQRFYPNRYNLNS